MRNPAAISEGTPARGRNLGHPNRRKQSDSAGQIDPINTDQGFCVLPRLSDPMLGARRESPTQFTSINLSF